jgi:hypothetical protein
MAEMKRNTSITATPSNSTSQKSGKHPLPSESAAVLTDASRILSFSLSCAFSKHCSIPDHPCSTSPQIAANRQISPVMGAGGVHFEHFFTLAHLLTLPRQPPLQLVFGQGL